jgi:hypothetical protein
VVPDVGFVDRALQALMLLLLQVGVAGLAGVGVPQAAGGHGLPCGPLRHPHALQVSARLHVQTSWRVRCMACVKAGHGLAVHCNTLMCD